MFDKKISFLGFQFPLVSIIIILIYLTISFVFKNILFYSLKYKYQKIKSIYKYDSARICKEFLDWSNKKAIIVFNNFKIWHFKKDHVYLINDNNIENSIWNHVTSLYEASSFSYKYTYRKYAKFISSVLILISMALLLIPNIYLIGFVLFFVSLLMFMMLNYYSCKSVKQINRMLNQNLNIDQAKEFKKLTKYFKYLSIYDFFVAPFQNISDAFTFILKKGIKGE